MADGRSHEYNVMKIFEEYGYYTVRSAGSGGGTKKAKPDVLVGNMSYTFAVEVKYRQSDCLYIDVSQVENLQKFADGFGAVPLVVVKFYRSPYFVFYLKDIQRVGKNYRIGYNNVRYKRCCTELHDFLELWSV